MRSGIRSAAAALLIVSIVVNVVAAVQGQAPCASDAAEAGQAALAAGEYAAAVDQFTCALQRDPTNVAAHQGRIEPALVTGQYGLAIADVNYLKDNAAEAFNAFQQTVVQAANVAPDSIEALMLRGFLYWATANDDLALIDFNAILQRDPDNGFALLFRGSSSQYLGNVLMAGDDFSDAAAVDASNPDVYSVIGSTYAQTGDYDPALQYLNRALQLDPGHARSHYFVGFVLLERDQIEAAITSLTRAIELDATLPDPYYDRGLAYGRQQNYSAALADLDRALALNPSFRLALVARARIHDLMGSASAALDDYARYIELNTLRQVNADPLFPDLPVTLNMEDGILYRMLFQASAGQVLTITAESPNDLADPLLMLLDPNGMPVIANDDRAIGDFTAEIASYAIPGDGPYTVLLTHSDGGYRGRVDVVLSLR